MEAGTFLITCAPQMQESHMQLGDESEALCRGVGPWHPRIPRSLPALCEGPR